ncbi:MAG: stage IV sporulation protein A, partial [Ruminococcaceae bacterium]|nr:stage IV sporulation protein A [Oscillospiraceae bacterium]
MNNSIYSDIARRTGGNIYLGIVGPVRSGKSTFISKLMNTLIIPNISDDFRKERANDELPQSSAGKTIMTTEPKFIPEEAVTITVEDGVQMNVRLIDCVGYIVPSAIGYIENEAPRMVATPWFDEEVPFNMAAEVGTRKVITEHSTIGIVVTTDGSITDIPRQEYEAAEERIITELQEINKPFVVLLNCQHPDSEESKTEAARLSRKYSASVLPVNCLDLNEEKIKEILGEVLLKFPVCEIDINMPKWINSLDKEHWLKSSVFDCIKAAASDIHGISDIKTAAEKMSECEYIDSAALGSIDLGTGTGVINIAL